jgi:lipid A 3-O-deacylase
MRAMTFATTFLVLAGTIVAAAAQQTKSAWELRGGAFAHDTVSPESGSVDLNAELLSPKLFSASPQWQVFVPRAHAGATVNTAGDTSHAYAGLTWSYDVTRRLFIEASFGGAVHSGKHGQTAERAAMGCSWSFRESGSLGWRFSDRLSAIATVEHVSNSGLCDQNRGLTNFGLRLGYSF